MLLKKIIFKLVSIFLFTGSLINLSATSAQSHLEQYNVSMEYAYNFISQNLSNPQIIYSVSYQFGITNNMLAEIVRYGGLDVSEVEVINWFAAQGIDSNSLDNTHELPSSISFVEIEGDSFTMGGVTTSNDAPAVTVTLTPYKISEKEITNAQYLTFLNTALENGYIEVTTQQSVNDPCGTYIADLIHGTTKSPYSDEIFIYLTNYGGCTSLGEPEDIQNRTYIAYDETAKLFYLADNTKAQWPANWITWYGASAFASFYNVSLPTEAQWEYAAKTDQELEYATDDGLLSLEQANYNGDLPGIYNPTGHVVQTGTYPPNPFGLYDMSGNVWEWCEDYYNSDFYQNNLTNPLNQISGTDNHRIRRGGSWNYHRSTLLNYARASDLPSRGNNHFGFRVVINP